MSAASIPPSPLSGTGEPQRPLSMAIAAGASTYAVGQVVKSHLMMGGTMSNLDVEYEKGKTVAKEASNDKEAGDVFQKLEKLGKLRDAGIITPEEFDAKKTELLKDI